MLTVNSEEIGAKKRGFLAGKNWAMGAYAKLSLKRKISVPFVSVFLGIWFSGTVAAGYYFSRDLEVRQLQEVEGVAWLVLREFQREIKKLRLDAKLLVEGTKITEAVSSQNQTALMQSLLPLQTALSLDLIKVVDAEGKVSIDLRNQQSKGLDLEDKVAISQVANGVDFSSVIRAKNQRAAILIGTAPIKSARGVIGGVIIGTVVNDELLFEIARLTNKDLVAFKKEKIIGSTIAKAELFSWKAPPKKSKLSISEAKVQIGDRSYLGKTVGLSGLNNTELKLVALASLAPLKIAKQKLALSVIFLSFFGVAIAFVVGYGVSGLIATRIARVTNAIEKIAAGELKTEVPVTYNDEIDKLAMGFNLMAEQLKERDRTITYQMHKLEETLQQLTRSIELIQSEKMSSLGQMVAGIAHEFNNPVSFIYGNVDPAIEYVDDLLEAINIYQQEYPHPTPLVEETISDLELDFVVEDLQSLLKSMKNGATRIRDIVEKLKTFSRLDQGGMKAVDIRENIDSALSLLQHRFYPIGAEGELIRKEIGVVKEYGDLPPVMGNPAQFNQVFISIFNNAIDALEEAIANNQISQNPQIKITTEVADVGWIKIIVADNGLGMTEEVRKQVFNPFFTTKPPGSGTGLGLSVSYSIVVEHHRGRLSCISAPGEGTEFVIEIPNN